MISQRLLHYEIVEKLGQGGMGVVYKARDTHLDRFVAIKVLPPEKIADPERKRRFVQEAKAASALNHPNIIHVYDIDQHAGIDYIAMEFVAGKTLGQWIGRKGLKLSEALKYAVQIADALGRAHAGGIIHRDLKPGNIMVDEHGLVKVLDFGLAKLTETAPPGEDEATRTLQPTTEQGTIVGTTAYMSPEQAEGKRVDARSDIFAFGSLLYEMLTGRCAFERDTRTSTLAAILTQEPPPLGPEVPPDVEKVISRCLRKDPGRRYQHMDDLKLALEELKEESDSGKLTAAQAPVRPRSHRFLWPAAVAVAVLALAAGSIFLWQRVHAAPLTDKDVLVLADFTNTTGDSVFDDTLKQGLAVQFEQSPFLNLVSDSTVNETLKLMGRPAGDRLTPEVTREVCQRTNSKAMLTGSIAPLGSQYVIGLKAVNCETGEALAHAQEQAADKETVLKALGAAATRMRGELGESLVSVRKYDTPLVEATTPSLEALKAYSLARKLNLAKGFTAALPFYRRATDLDPGFASAYGWMSDLYNGLVQGGQAAECASKAYALREKVSERERFNIEGRYYLFATGDLEKAATTFELYQQTYPRDDEPYRNLGLVLCRLGDWEKTLEEAREALRLEPSMAVNYTQLARAYKALNRLGEAEAVDKQMRERRLEHEGQFRTRYWLAFLKGDAAQMARIVSAAAGKPGAEEPLLAIQADTEGWYGKLKNAHELTGRAMDSALHNNAKEAAAAYQARAALRDVEPGCREQARAEAEAAVKLAKDRDVWVIAALALALAGDTAGAEKLAAELDKTFPLDTLVQSYWLPAIRAGVALQSKDPDRAIELLKVVSPVELGGQPMLGTYMIPAYVRGEAYLMLHDGNGAAVEFQKFIDHRGLVATFSWGALARLGLARAYALQGDTVKARAAYQDFLTLWKDADPDVPILKEAKAEYAKLR